MSAGLILFGVSHASLSRIVEFQRIGAAPGDGHMLLFWDGGSAPSGWTCVSCSPGDDFYQLFPRGSDIYGGTGGASTHNHSSTDSIANTASAAASVTEPGAALSNNTHSHTVSVTKSAASNLPNYRQLSIIRSNTNGEPSTIPSGAIAMFDSAPPAGWNTYSAQDGYYVRGEGTAGVTGGSNTHNHSLTITIGNATGGTQGVRNGSPAPSAVAGHSHTASGVSNTVNNEPPYIETIFGQATSTAAPPDNMIAMWDDDAPTNWTLQSGSTGSFYQRFPKGSASFGASGGAGNHVHTNTAVTTSGPTGGATNSRSGSTTASSTHTHIVNIENYSTETHLPPYRDVLFAKRVPQSTFEQSGYRFFTNTNSTDVGSPLAGLNSTAASPRIGTPFRLRMIIHVDGADLETGNKNFKLQYAVRSGTCDASFTGETYIDVLSGSGAIQYHNNSSPNDGSSVTTNLDDPTHGADAVIPQTYEEENNFSNISTIAVGEDGLWDFSLVDSAAPPSTNYCFRVVTSTNDLLDSYTAIPEIITDDGQGHMLLFWDGGSAPSGWTCVSCSPGDDFYQRFFRGSDTYGATGGASTHGHTATGSVAATTGTGIEVQAGSGIASGGHSHSFSPIIADASNLPLYRQLNVIRANSSGVPSTIPSGAIAMFDSAPPAGWNTYSAQDGYYVRGEGTAGVTGGSNTHNHAISGTTTNSTGQNSARTNGATISSALNGHSHTVSGNSNSSNGEPPFIEVVFGQSTANAPAPLNIVTLWDNPAPSSWTVVSGIGGPFEARFVKGASTYGGTGGGETHAHTDTVIVSSGPSTTGIHRSGTGSADGVHTHDVTISSFSTENHLPPYIEVIVATLGVLNTPPNDPTNLDQERTNDSSQIPVGGYTNSGQIRFTADATDTDNPDDLQLCVELQEIGDAFTNTPTACGSLVNYSGSTVAVDVSVAGLSDGANYHWQAQIKDGSGGVSGWVSFGSNLESAPDFINDASAPSGLVYDGATLLADIDYNDSSLDELSANWDISDSLSGVVGYEVSIGTLPGAQDISSWNSNGLSQLVTVSGLNLQTSLIYYFNIRSTDAAGNQSTLSSDGVRVAPTLSFAATPSNITFDNLNAANSYTATETTILTTNTNAYGGYAIRAYLADNLTSTNADIISGFSGGTYAAPDEWLAGDTGYGYTSNDPSVAGTNLFAPTVCLGGGSPPCYAPFSIGSPGDIIADNEGPVSGSPIIDENFIITHRVTTADSQPPGTYSAIINYLIYAIF